MTVGNVQLPGEKVAAIGQAYGVGLAGDDNMMALTIQALRASALANDVVAARPIASAATIAREALRDASTEYLSRVLWAAMQPIDSQIGLAHILFGGLASDGPFLMVLDNRGNTHPPFQPNYAAIGSARETALVLMRAYAAYDYAAHPLDTSVLLAKRVMDQVSAVVPLIGGQTSILAISQQAGPHGHLRMIDPNSALIQDGLTTWQLLEAEMFADLAAGVNPPAAEPPAPPRAAAPPGGVAPAADLPPDLRHP
jgi:20S proteasome alpha/beta subunit